MSQLGLVRHEPVINCDWSNLIHTLKYCLRYVLCLQRCDVCYTATNDDKQLYSKSQAQIHVQYLENEDVLLFLYFKLKLFYVINSKIMYIFVREITKH